MDRAGRFQEGGRREIRGVLRVWSAGERGPIGARSTARQRFAGVRSDRIRVIPRSGRFGHRPPVASQRSSDHCVSGSVQPPKGEPRPHVATASRSKLAERERTRITRGAYARRCTLARRAFAKRPPRQGGCFNSLLVNLHRRKPTTLIRHGSGSRRIVDEIEMNALLLRPKKIESAERHDSA